MAATRSHRRRTGRSGDRAPPAVHVQRSPRARRTCADRRLSAAKRSNPLRRSSSRPLQLHAMAICAPVDAACADSGMELRERVEVRAVRRRRAGRRGARPPSPSLTHRPVPGRCEPTKAASSAKAASKSSRSPCRRDAMSVCQNAWSIQIASDRVGAQRVCHARALRSSASASPKCTHHRFSATSTRPSGSHLSTSAAAASTSAMPVHGRSDRRPRQIQLGSDRDQRWPPLVVGAHVERGPHELRRGGVDDARRREPSVGDRGPGGDVGPAMLDREPASLADESTRGGEVADLVPGEAVTDDQDGVAPKLGRIECAVIDEGQGAMRHGHRPRPMRRSQPLPRPRPRLRPPRCAGRRQGRPRTGGMRRHRAQRCPRP